MPSIRVYLAGPEVFLTNAKEIGENKKALCRKYGFEGVFPIDIEVDAKGKSPKEVGLCISGINENLIKSCDIVIANITPFRGPSADVGTAYEMGFAHALGKKVFAYTNVAVPFTERTMKALNAQVSRSSDGRLRDSQGMFIEEVELVDNLMIDGCIHASSKKLVVEQTPADQLYTYLGGFEKCLKAAKELVSAGKNDR
ncbi:MAG: nucleoside 2-deoxyribosyltransferase [Candidatus Bathyarchaeota archaeon]|nr:nucleoside 2-deoxyribosyltransferase [Candidatus Bathyarchaeota archaeon]